MMKLYKNARKADRSMNSMYIYYTYQWKNKKMKSNNLTTVQGFAKAVFQTKKCHRIRNLINHIITAGLITVGVTK